MEAGDGDLHRSILASASKPRLAVVSASQAEAADTVMRLLESRDPGKTICPSDAAREIDPENFRELMPTVRDAARDLVAAGRIEVTQSGEVVDIDTARGAIRLRLRP
jgi:hypothetical protein